MEIIRRGGSTPFEIKKTICLGQAANNDESLHKEMEEALRSRLLLWLNKMQSQNQLPRTADRLANAIANMCFVSYKANAELLYEELLKAGFVSVDTSGGANIHGVAAENYRSEYSTIGQSYRYNGMGSTAHLHSDGDSKAQLAFPTRPELAAMARDRSIRWLGGLRGFTGNAKSFFNQLKHICTFKVLLDSTEVVAFLVDDGLVSLAPDDCNKISGYTL